MEKMKQKYEKIFKREDGSQVKVIVSFGMVLESPFNDLLYKFEIYKKDKGKRKWIHHPVRYDGVMTEIDREFITDSELLQAKQEFWKTLEPK